MPSNLNNTNNEIYIYKTHKLYAKVLGNSYYRLKNDEFVLANDEVCEILDILPEGIDLVIMLRSFNAKEPIELLPYVRNTIGDFDFSSDSKKTNFDKAVLSNLKMSDEFPCVFDLKIKIENNILYPSSEQNLQENIGTQNLSLSGAQHKLQISIVDGVIKNNYGDFILKPYNYDYAKLTYNEYLNVNFMREFGFEVPFNALVYDGWHKDCHYIIKRFDIDENGNRLPQISLNALMKSKFRSKGSIEEVGKFLKDKLDDTQKMLFLRYIYANALLHNNDLHKKNVSFMLKNNKLVLSPVYDVINIYPIRKLGKTQCCLPINNKINHIKIKDFEKSALNLGLDFKNVRENLLEIRTIYFEKYPNYATTHLKEILDKLPHKNLEMIQSFKDLRNKLLNSYDKCVKTAKKEDDEMKIILDPNDSSAMDGLREDFYAKQAKNNLGGNKAKIKKPPRP